MSKWRRRYMASRAQAEQHRRECRHVAVHEDAHIVIGKSFGASVSRGKICCEVKLNEPRAGPMDPALDRPYRALADGGGLLVREA